MHIAFVENSQDYVDCHQRSQQEIRLHPGKGLERTGLTFKAGTHTGSETHFQDFARLDTANRLSQGNVIGRLNEIVMAGNSPFDG